MAAIITGKITAGVVIITRAVQQEEEEAITRVDTRTGRGRVRDVETIVITTTKTRALVGEEAEGQPAAKNLTAALEEPSKYKTDGFCLRGFFYNFFFSPIASINSNL